MSVSIAAQMVHEIERLLLELRREYTLFFNDNSSVEPIDLRHALEANIKRLRNLNMNRTEDQFRANNAIAKAQSHLQLWDRQLDRKYMGDPQARRQKRKAPPPPPQKREETGVMISNAMEQRERVEELYDQYMKLNMSLGAKKAINFTKFQNFIQGQTEKLRAGKGAQQVRYEVTVQNDKVVIKTKAK